MGKNTAYQIQQKAIKLFREKGYGATTIEDICKEAGVTRSTFFYHYKSKEQLIEKFYSFSHALTPEATRVLAMSDNCWEKLWASMQPSIDWTIDAGAEILTQVFIMNLSQNTNSFANPDSEHVKTLMTDIIRQGQQLGHFKNNSPADLLCENVQNVILGIAVQWCIAGGSYDEKAAIRQSVEALLCVKEELTEI